MTAGMQNYLRSENAGNGREGGWACNGRVPPLELPKQTIDNDAKAGARQNMDNDGADVAGLDGSFAEVFCGTRGRAPTESLAGRGRGHKNLKHTQKTRKKPNL